MELTARTVYRKQRFNNSGPGAVSDNVQLFYHVEAMDEDEVAMVRGVIRDKNVEVESVDLIFMAHQMEGCRDPNAFVKELTRVKVEMDSHTMGPTLERSVLGLRPKFDEPDPIQQAWSEYKQSKSED